MSACVRDRECESVCVLQIKTSVDADTSDSRIICRPIRLHCKKCSVNVYLNRCNTAATILVNVY